MLSARSIAVLCAALCLSAGAARAHDSWFSPSGGTTLALATGNRYPVQDVGPGAASVARSGCSDGESHAVALRPAREQPRWLEMAAGATDAALLPLACWAELHAAQIELTPQLVQVYLAEIHAPAAVRTAWADLRARGEPWRESYRKFARIELAAAGDAPPGLRAAARRPTGLALEIVVQGDAPVAVGQPLDFQVLRDGRPLAGFAVELVSERSALGVWRETDAQGMLRHRLPFGGRWLLRGTDLRESAERPATWESRFVTLAIEAR
jgi:hypothetical protein